MRDPVSKSKIASNRSKTASVGLLPPRVYAQVSTSVYTVLEHVHIARYMHTHIHTDTHYQKREFFMSALPIVLAIHFHRRDGLHLKTQLTVDSRTLPYLGSKNTNSENKQMPLKAAVFCLGGGFESATNSKFFFGLSAEIRTHPCQSCN